MKKFHWPCYSQSIICPEKITFIMTDSIFQYRLNLLRDEISRIQTRIGHYDDLVFRIKGWTITLWIGTVGFSVTQKSPFLLLASVPVTIAFWFVETQYKRYQHRFICRMRYIERMLNLKGIENIGNLEVVFKEKLFGSFLVYDPTGWQTAERDDSFRKELKKNTGFWRCFWRKHVRSLYLFLLSFSFIAFAVLFFVLS